MSVLTPYHLYTPPTEQHSICSLPIAPNITALELVNPAKPRFLVSGLDRSICYKLQAFQLCALCLLCPECDGDEVLTLVVEDAFGDREFGLRAQMIDCNNC